MDLTTAAEARLHGLPRCRPASTSSLAGAPPRHRQQKLPWPPPCLAPKPASPCAASSRVPARPAAAGDHPGAPAATTIVRDGLQPPRSMSRPRPHQIPVAAAPFPASRSREPLSASSTTSSPSRTSHAPALTAPCLLASTARPH